MKAKNEEYGSDVGLIHIYIVAVYRVRVAQAIVAPEQRYIDSKVHQHALIEVKVSHQKVDHKWKPCPVEDDLLLVGPEGKEKSV